MSYKKEVEKVIKNYLLPIGFKYKPKNYRYVRQYTNDIIQTIGFGEETHGRPHYYYLRTYVGVASKSLNEILYEVTNGKVDYREFHIGPVYLSRIKSLSERDDEYFHCEFFGTRPMDENITEFDMMFKTDVLSIYEKYKTQKSIYTYAVHEIIYFPSILFYAPLNYYFAGQFNKAFEFIDDQIKLNKANIKELGSYEEAVNNIKTYEIYRKNLKQWIKDCRQFKVDDEYLPNFIE